MTAEITAAEMPLVAFTAALAIVLLTEWTIKCANRVGTAGRAARRSRNAKPCSRVLSGFFAPNERLSHTVGAREVTMDGKSSETPEQGVDRSDHSLLLGSRVKGTPVFDRTGARIGHVDDLSIDRPSGEVVYAVLSIGGFLGLGERYHPLPWSFLHYDPERRGYVVSLDKAALKAAPNYDLLELDNLGGTRREARGEPIYGYYAPFGDRAY